MALDADDGKGLSGPDMNVQHCPICLWEPFQVQDTQDPTIDAYLCKCSRCGSYIVDGMLFNKLVHGTASNRRFATALSHAVRRMGMRLSPPRLEETLVARIRENPRIPNPAEQADMLVLWFGDRAELGQVLEFDPERDRSIIGALDAGGFEFVVRHLIDEGLLKPSVGNAVGGSLTFRGWRYYEEVRRGSRQSRKAFMAMPFGDDTLDGVYRDCFKPAVKRAGFDLVRLDETTPAGSIDDRLRVEIRTARFMIAELSHGNRGAYWEAGYAEGLGKPVIYTCEKKQWDSEGTHFDTNHLHTVVWTKEELEDAASRLTASVRATFPEEAQMTDEVAV